ncbi:MAG: tetraacyldisaccharide 4'-kinase, partial [Casimicrobiaceae bacterium]
LSWLYGGLIRFRYALYRLGVFAHGRAPVPVIVVGNLVVGGTGKTPFTASLIEALSQAGFRPGVISRGHPVAPAAPILVTASSSAEEVGDEPLIHRARGVPVVVCRNRLRAARHLCTLQPEIDVIVADDALQHYRLARDIEIELVSAERGYGNRHLLPVGPLREPLGRAATCDFRVLVGDDRTDSPAGFLSDAIRIRRELACPRHLLSGRTADWTMFRGRRIMIMAGIAHPESFARSLADHGITGELLAFPDHHLYRADDFAGLPDAPIFVTEKDAVKLGRLGDERIWVVTMRLVLPASFVATLVGRLHALRGAAAPFPAVES